MEPIWIWRMAAVPTAIAVVATTSLAWAKPIDVDSDVQPDYNICIASFYNDGFGDIVDHLTNSEHYFSVVKGKLNNNTKASNYEDAHKPGLGSGAKIFWDPTDQHVFNCDNIRNDPCATL